MSPLRARWVARLGLALALAAAPGAAAEDEPASFGRVVVAESALRAGPGMSHRVLHVATRGETLRLEGRAADGYWLRVVLPDGRVAFALGDTLEPLSLDEDAPDAPGAPGWFSPPPLAEARGGFALLAGLFAGAGYAEVRPALVLAPAAMLEPFAGIALSTEGRRFAYGLGGTLAFAPDWPVTPIVHLAAGALTTVPNQDAEVLRGGTVTLARAGGGLLLSLRHRILVRAEAHQVVLFEPDFHRDALSFTLGLGTYF